MSIIPVTLFFDAGSRDSVLNINYGPNATPGINISLPINYVYGVRIHPPNLDLYNPEIRIMILINEFAADAFYSPVKYHAVLSTADTGKLSTRLNNNGEYWFAKPILPPSTLSFTFSNGLQRWADVDPTRTIIPVTFFCTLASQP